ncbi:CD276 antigen-like [Leuresthes tenuis]|uniref:CD276 antigen-like n=1 Tax=Leuresthes tenuis TaxID=355514 RepID=UPI003B511542
MTEIKRVMFSVVLAFLLILSNGDTEVSCVVLRSCVLPCSFQGGSEVIIQWIQMTSGLIVHSHENYQNQVSQHFRGRTSLFQDQISRGNASLQLTGVKIQDQGRYKCLIRAISGISDSIINLKVDAPVSEVNIDQIGNRITCSSNWIYPEPELTWSTSPPSNMSLQNTTTVQQTEQQLYNISSSLILSDSDTDLIYSCTVSNHRNKRTATVNKLDTELSCVVMEICILPCSFQGGDDTVIHWIQLTAGHSRVHSFYQNRDQLGLQDQCFRGRTSLFQDQISRGNASLQLTGVKIQDQGRYECFISTIRGNKDTFINLKVDAPVRKVSIDQVGNRITCSSNWIYPEPELTWSTSPPSNMNLQNTTTVQQTEQQLYNISSSLILSDSDTDLIYSCTVSTRTSCRRATWRQISSVIGSSSETTIPCSASNTSLTSLIWIFNHNQIILNKAGPDVTSTVSEEWRQHVKNVSESGSLTLQDLTSLQQGKYTCELSNSEETMIADISLRMSSENSANVAVIIASMVVAILIVAAIFILVKLCKKIKGKITVCINL